MKKPVKRTESATPQATGVRRRTEKKSRKKAVRLSKNQESMSPEETQQALHELRVHQVELEMQNEELKAARARYFDLYDLAPVGYITVSEQGLVLEANLTATTLLSVSRGNLMNQLLTRFILKEDQDIYYLHRKKLLDTGKPQMCELRMVKKNGTVFWAHLSGAAARAEDGTTACRVVMSDITESKDMDAKLRREEQRFRALADQSSDIIVLLNREGVITYENPAVEKALGLKIEERIGATGFEHLHPDDFKLVADTYDILFSDINAPVQQSDIRFRHIDGSWRTFEVVASNLIHDKVIEAVIINLRDITERKRMEEALHQSEEKYRTLLESVQEGYFELDLAGNFTFFNDSLCRIYNYSKEELMDMNYRHYTDKETRKNGFHEFNKVYNTGEPLKGFTWPIIGKDGTKRYVETSASLLKDSSGKPIGFRGILHDITARKRAEEELKKYREQLEGLVQERTIKLEASNKELEAFSYSISHDLRAPLRAIDGFSQALLEDCEDKLDLQGKDYLIRIRAATQRMSTLIEDLLNLSRITRSEMSMEKVNLTRIVRSVINELQNSQPQRHVKIRIADGLEDIADSRLISIALENLMSNAWKFTAKQSEALIEFGSTREGSKKVYFIRDNGAGFEMTYMDKLFAPFQRLHTIDEYPGTGIGLATVRRIIHRHGGKVWAEGHTGKGATFYFSINE
jgi:PAS domain S-box-containing protein